MTFASMTCIYIFDEQSLKSDARTSITQQVSKTCETEDIETHEYKNLWEKYFVLNVLHFQWENKCLSILTISYDNNKTLFPQTALVIQSRENIRHINTNTQIISICVRKIYS